jgi:DnaK suppressor protein
MRGLVDLHQYAAAQPAHDSYMSTTPTTSDDLFKAQLIEARDQLLARIAYERGGVISRADMAAEHFNNSFQSRAQILTERQTEFALNEHETAQLVDIDAALKRIEAGTYAQCSDCGTAIPPARLNAYPTAKRCITCQTQKEQRR